MFYVRAAVSGPWRTIDLLDSAGHKWGEKYLVVALEQGRWSVDGKPVEVHEYLAVSFRDPSSADYFLQSGRADTIAVEPGMVVIFADESDADYFVNRGLGVRISQVEFDQIVELNRIQHEQALMPEHIEAVEAQEDEPTEPVAAKPAKPARKSRAPSRKKATA